MFLGQEIEFPFVGLVSLAFPPNFLKNKKTGLNVKNIKNIKKSTFSKYLNLKSYVKKNSLSDESIYKRNNKKNNYLCFSFSLGTYSGGGL
jgi:hypothetical protein